MGIIGGGLEDGSVELYDPALIVEEGGVESVIARLAPKHGGAVRGLEFNTFSAHLLASGASDGELRIWNLSAPTAPQLYPALKGAAGGAGSDVAALAWNPRVQHILASSTAGGTTVVWDLNKQMPVIKLADPSAPRRCSALAWNPELATQLVVASDNDAAPTLQVWDLRNSISPLKELSGHSKGVLSLAWCPSDASLLASAGKDNRTLIWDMATAEVLAEIPAGGNWNFDLQWSKALPGVLSCASYDCNVRIFNCVQDTAVSAAGAAASTNAVLDSFGIAAEPLATHNQASNRPKSAYSLKKAPAWLKRPIGASFGFGGRLMSFGLDDSAKDARHSLKAVGMSCIALEEEMIARSARFRDLLKARDRESMAALCCDRAVAATKAGASVDSDTWKFLGVLFKEDARRDLLTALNFELPTVGDSALASAKAATASTTTTTMALDGTDDDSSACVGALSTASVPADSGEGFWDISSDAPAAGPVVSARPSALVAQSTPPKDAHDAKVERALVVGDYERAVKECMAVERFADALVLAATGGRKLWEATQRQYMDLRPRSFMHVAKAIVDKDLQGMVNTRPTEAWQETLALLCTYAPSDEWASLCMALALRLAAAGEAEAASLCYVCAGSVEEAVSEWTKSIPSGAAAIGPLQDVVEKAIMLKLATETSGSTPGQAFATLLAAYADLLAAQGALGAAADVLAMVPEEGTSTTAMLRDRVQRSLGDTAQDTLPPSSALSQVPCEALPSSTQDHAGGHRRPQPVQQAPTQDARLPVQQQQSHAYQPLQPYANTAPPAAPAVATTQMPAVPQSYSPVSPAPFAHTASVAPTPYQPTTFSPAMAPASGVAVPSPAAPAPYVPVPAPSSAAPTMPMPYASAAVAPVPSVPPPAPFVPQAMPAGSVPPTGQRQVRPLPTHTDPLGDGRAAVAPRRVQPPGNICVATVDISKVSEDMQLVAAVLKQLHEGVAGAAPPAKKREMDDNSRRLGGLLWKLNEGEISGAVCSKLQSLCTALKAGDLAGAYKVQVSLTTSDWDECSQWLTALKRLLKARLV